MLHNTVQHIRKVCGFSFCFVFYLRGRLAFCCNNFPAYLFLFRTQESGIRREICITGRGHVLCLLPSAESSD